jgi:hypothetical protein
MSAGTFAAFSKFHLNTSNSPNTKVVCFVEGHNFHVEWHLKFGVEMCEKMQVNASGYYSSVPRNQQPWHANCAKTVEKKTLRPLQKL